MKMMHTALALAAMTFAVAAGAAVTPTTPTPATNYTNSEVTDMAVSATVLSGCTAPEVTPLDFGTNYQRNADITTTADINFDCGESVVYSIELGAGAYATADTRNVSDGNGNVIAYALDSDLAGTAWGDGTNYGNAVDGVGDMGADTQMVYGTLTLLQDSFASSGSGPEANGTPGTSYSDSVTVTLKW